MSNTNFVDQQSIIYASWLNDVNNTVYNVLGNGTSVPTTVAQLIANIGVPTITGSGATGTWPISVTGTANNVSGVVSVTNGGTGATTSAAAINGLLPSQSSHTGQYLTTNGTTCSWAAISVPTAVPSGAVFHFAMVTAPSGYLECNGSAVSRTTYASLFSAIGTTFGSGDGATTFNLPDLRGQFIRGYDDGKGVDPSRSFGSSQGSTFTAHNHSASVSDPGHGHGVSDPGHSHVYGEQPNGGYAAGSGGWRVANPNVYNNYSTTSSGTGISINANGTGISVSTGNTGSSETRPVNVALLPCIKT